MQCGQSGASFVLRQASSITLAARLRIWNFSASSNSLRRRARLLIPALNTSTNPKNASKASTSASQSLHQTYGPRSQQELGRHQGEVLECTTTADEVYGPRNARLGRRAVDGNIWSETTMIFRIIDDRVYSMHEQYLGRLKYGMVMTDRGELIFMVR